MVVIKKVEAGKEGRGFPSYYELESLTEQSADTQEQGGGQNLDFVESLELETIKGADWRQGQWQHWERAGAVGEWEAEAEEVTLGIPPVRAERKGKGNKSKRKDSQTKVGPQDR